MSEEHALQALEEVRQQLRTDVSSELLREILRIEQEYAFDADPDLALREIERIIEAHLRGGDAG